MLAFILTATTFCACEKDGNPNNLPDIDPSTYEGTVEGYRTSEEIFKENLVANFSFDDTYNETITNTAPTSKTGDSFVAGFKGKALNLDAGYLYYATQFAAFKTDVFKSFTISQWVQIPTARAKRGMLLTITRPGLLQGNLNLNLNATDPLKPLFLAIVPVFATVGGNTQDNANSNVSPIIGDGNWVNIVIAYNGLTGRFNILANGINIGSFSDRGVGNNVFKSYEPSEFIIGANYNLIPGKTVNTDAAYAPLTAKIDELKIYNAFMPDAIVKARYDLIKAGK
jgi:hypothetical protein